MWLAVAVAGWLEVVVLLLMARVIDAGLLLP